MEGKTKTRSLPLVSEADRRRGYLVYARLILGLTLGAASLAFAADLPRSAEAAWPTLHGDLQRSGFYPRFPKGPLRLAWRKELWRELTGPRAEVMVGGGLAFMGTYAGNLYAWDAASGADKWVFKAGGPIGHSPAFCEGTLFFGAMDRRLYAVDTASGQARWSCEAGEGIWVSPVVHQGLVMFGARDGVFQALDTKDGQKKWRFQTGGPILTTASVSEDGARVVFASEDMHVYCLSANLGQLLWKSPKLAGLSVRDYAPVIVRGLVLSRRIRSKIFTPFWVNTKTCSSIALVLPAKIRGISPAPGRTSSRNRLSSSIFSARIPKNERFTRSAWPMAPSHGSPPSFTPAACIILPRHPASIR
jgi:hypothetical protein